MAEVNNIQEFRGFVVAGATVIAGAAAQMMMTSFEGPPVVLSLYYIFGFLGLNVAGLLITSLMFDAINRRVAVAVAATLVGLRLLIVPQAVIIVEYS